MNKKILTVMAIMFFAGGFLFAGGGSEEAQAGEKLHYNLVFSSNAAPTASHGKAVNVFKEEIERTTDGQISVEVYLAGSLTTQEGQLPACRKGTIDMTMGAPNWFVDFLPYVSMLAAPYMLEDYDHMTKVMNGEVGEKIRDDLLEAAGVRILTTMYMGTRQLNLRDIGRVVDTPADMKGVKLRMPGSESWQFMGEALGANPTPLAISELYLALKTGTVDGQDNPLPAATIQRKFYEVTKYIILTGHYVNPIMPIINEDTWKLLGPELQEKVIAAWEVAREFCDNDVLENEKSAEAFLEGEGLEIIEVDRQLWRDHVVNYYLDHEEVSGNWDMELYEMVKKAAK